MRTVTVAVLAWCLACGIAFGQDEVFMMDDCHASVMIDIDYDPPIALRKTGDFLVLRVKVENDSRDPEARKREMDETLLRLVKAAGLTGRFELHSGEYALTPKNHGLALSEDGSRPDTSYAHLFIKVPLAAEDDVPKLTQELQEFVTAAEVSGRTQLSPGKVGLSVVNPEQYRYELLELIAKDISRLSEIFGGAYGFEVKGLDRRLGVRRVSVTQVELYLKYSFSMRSR